MYLFKRIKIVILCFLPFIVKGQIPVQRSTSGVTVMDSRLKANLNLVGPAYHDTTAANVQKGLDSLGAIIYDSTHNIYWFRGWNGAGGKKWITFGGSSLTNPMTTKGDIIFENAALAPDRLAGNTTTIRRWLNSTGTGAAPNLPFYDTLASSDITNALGYTPYPSTNPNGYISSLTLPPLYLKNGLHARDSVTAVLGGSLDSNTNINVNGQVFKISNLPHKSASGTDSVLIEDNAHIVYKTPLSAIGVDFYTTDGSFNSTRTADLNNNLLQFSSSGTNTTSEFDINITNSTFSTGTFFSRGISSAQSYASSATVINGHNENVTYAEQYGSNAAGTHTNRIRTYPDSMSFNSYNGFYRFQNPIASSDSTTYKPAALDATGKLVRLSYWPGSGGGGSTLTRQNITSGSSGTVTGGNYIVNFNPSSVIAAYSLTLPASPSDKDVVEIEAGGTITSGGPVVTALTILANSGQTLIQAVTPTTINSGEYIKYRYNSSTTSWYREN